MSDTREALRQIESALADMLETYAEMRSEYLNNANDDARQALGIEIDAYRSAARLVRAHRVEDSGMGLPSWRWHEWAVKEREISDRLDAFAVIPRSEITGTEYGWRADADGWYQGWHEKTDAKRSAAEHLARNAASPEMRT